MVTRVGMMGMSEGNGHPFSFSAIINGFSRGGMQASGWAVIYDYLSKRHPEEFGIGDLRVTHAWTQNPLVTATLCRATRIDQRVEHPEQMLGEVDALIIARDDAESHWPLARPFLEAGLPVFIDKPLALDRESLTSLTPFLEKGQLMSCSGLRYASELDELRNELSSYGTIKMVRGTILNDWARYGIHLLEAIHYLLPSRPVSVRALPTGHETLLIRLENGTSVIIDALGDVPAVFDIEVLGTRRIKRYSLRDNFIMFRRMLVAFNDLVINHRSSITPSETLLIIQTLIAGCEALESSGEVQLN